MINPPLGVHMRRSGGFLIKEDTGFAYQVFCSKGNARVLKVDEDVYSCVQEEERESGNGHDIFKADHGLDGASGRTDRG